MAAALLFALVSDDSHFAIDLYPSREQAEAALRDVLADEPAFQELLRLVEIDLSVLTFWPPTARRSDSRATLAG